MPVKDYCVLKGKVVDKMRSTVKKANNHYQIKLDAQGTFYRIPVNAKSKVVVNGSTDLFYFRDEDFQHPILSWLEQQKAGVIFKNKMPNQRGIDYVRGNLFDLTRMRVLPEWEEGERNDLNDFIDLYVEKARHDPNAFCYAFGAHFEGGNGKSKAFGMNPDRGVHDIHMNQGNPKPKKSGESDFTKDNGIWQDGALLFHFPDEDKWVAIFLRFQSQSVSTDEQGHPKTERPQPIPIGFQKLRIIAALVHPQGLERGNERIMLFNPKGEPISVDGWKISDKRNQTERLEGVIEPGKTFEIALGTNGLQLGNESGTLLLQDDDDNVIHGVTYQKTQVHEGEWVVF